MIRADLCIFYSGRHRTGSEQTSSCQVRFHWGSSPVCTIEFDAMHLSTRDNLVALVNAAGTLSAARSVHEDQPTRDDGDGTMINLRSLDLNLLTVFEAIYETGTVTGSGDCLALSKSATSHALSRLREACGDALFIRAGQ